MVILCGGRGTRLQEITQSIPKPLVEIGGKPILWHVMQIYIAQGFRRFILPTGYKGEMVQEFAQGEDWPADVAVKTIDTGIETPTAERIHRVRDHLGEKDFCVTYTDCLADVDLQGLLRFHREHDGLATMTVVRPSVQFGVADLDGDNRVQGFHEKPQYERWVNGGFMCFDNDALPYMDGEPAMLEREPLERLAADGQLYAFRHESFWHAMDTYKEAVALNDLWREARRPPWKLWA